MTQRKEQVGAALTAVRVDRAVARVVRWALRAEAALWVEPVGRRPRQYVRPARVVAIAVGRVQAQILKQRAVTDVRWQAVATAVVPVQGMAVVLARDELYATVA